MRTLKNIIEPGVVKKGCVLTIGNFDGVHLGHQDILAQAGRIASERAAEVVVMTFEPHPAAVLRPEKAPDVLTPLILKERLLAEAGVNQLVVLEPAQELLSLTPDEFAKRFLVDGIQPCVVVEGPNFGFGAGRSGTAEMLRETGIRNGFEVVVVEARQTRLSDGQMVKVSSTLIRGLLKNGRAADAAIALGRPYRLAGKVVRGRGKGRQLGFATANMEPPGQLIPAEGVYAGFVETGESVEDVCASRQRIPAAFSIGRSKTYGCDNALLIEAHLLSGDPGDLVGKWMVMDFIGRIREQRQFETEADLARQIARDCERVRRILSKMEGQ